MAALDAARGCGFGRGPPGRGFETRREQAAALDRAADGSDGGGWGGAVSDRGLCFLLGYVRGSGDGRAAGCLVVVGTRVRIYDPVAGGAALVVIDVDDYVEALAVFKDPATGEPRLACGLP